MAEDNPSRWTMEYITDWFLFYRSSEDLRNQGKKLQISPATVEVEAEPLGINLFLDIVK